MLLPGAGPLLPEQAGRDPAAVEVGAALAAAPRVAVVPHVLPDLDALASAAALAAALRRAGRDAWVLAPERPALHAWVVDPDLVAEAGPAGDCLRVAVDTARPDRLQVPGPVAVNLDHHEDNPGYGACNWVRSAPSCTCLVAAVGLALGVAPDPALATVLYAGLYGDTEGFRVHLDPAAFAWAQAFVAAGADAEGVAERFHRRSPGFWRYLAAVAERERALPGPVPCRVFPVPAALPQAFPLEPFEAALLPSHLTPPAGGVVVILQEGRDAVRFRLRSRGVDLLPLAHALGGGGHPQAAGVVLRGVTLEQALARLEAAWSQVVGASRRT